jgi:hypothetical protein
MMQTRFSFRAALLALPGVLLVPRIEADPGVFDAHLAKDPEGQSAFTFDVSDYEGDLSSLPIGVFDSGIGGLTVLEALLTLDAFHNDTLQARTRRRARLSSRNASSTSAIRPTCPMATTAAVQRTDFLRELIVKDAVFLLGRRVWPAEGTNRSSRQASRQSHRHRLQHRHRLRPRRHPQAPSPHGRLP